MKKLLAILFFVFICTSTSWAVINDVSPKTALFDCDGSTTEFSFSFTVEEKADIEVIIVDSSNTETELTVDTDYTVSISADGTGSITTTSTYSSSYDLLIRRDTEKTQELDLQEGGVFSAEALEDSLDKVTRLAQENSERLDRAALLQKTNQLSVSLPNPSADKSLCWDSSAQQLTNCSTSTATSVIFDYIGNYSSLSSAVSDIGASVTVLVIDSETALASGESVTIPSTLHLYFLNGGYIKGVSGGAAETLTVIGPITGEGEIFGDDLTVDYQSQSHYKLVWRGGDLETAVSDIGSNIATLIIDTNPDDLTADLEIPSTTATMWRTGNTLGGAFTLTFNKNPAAGLYPLFESALTVAGLTIAYPEWFGADYTTDSVTEFNDSINALTAGGTLDLRGRSFRLDSTVTVKTKISVVGDLSHYIDFSNAVDTDTAFEATGTFSTAASLTVNANIGDTTVTAPGHSLVAGDIGQIRSDGVWTGSVKDAEFFTVSSVSGDDVTFVNALIRPYTTANNALLSKLTPVENVVFDGLWIKGDTTNDHWGIHITGGKNAIVKNCRFDSLKRRGVRFLRCYGFIADNIAAYDSNENGLGYGVAIASSQNGSVSNSRFFNCRHGVSIGGDSYAPTRFVTLESNIVEGATDAGLDSHAPSEFITYSNNIIRNSGAGSEQDGIIHQGSTASFLGNKIVDCGRIGIFVQTQSNVAADEHFSIKSNDIIGSVSTGIAVDVGSAGGAARNIVITNNKVISAGAKGVAITADALVEDICVNGNTIYEPATIGLHLNASGNDIKGGSVSGNNIDMGTTTNEGIYFQGTATTVVENIAVGDNFIRYGSVGFRGTFTNFLTVIGNVSAGATTGFNYAGAACVPVLASVATLNAIR